MEHLRGKHISKVGSIVLRKNKESWDVLVGYYRGKMFFPKGHLEGNEPVEHARTECVEEVRQYPLTCQGRLLSCSYNYWDVNVCTTIDWYLFTSSTPVYFEPVETYDLETTHHWIPLQKLSQEIEEYSPQHQLPMNRLIIEKILEII